MPPASVATVCAQTRVVSIEASGLGHTIMRENNLPLTHGILTFLVAYRVGPLEICNLAIEPIESLASAIEARFVNPSAFTLVCGRAPPRVHSGRPLEISLSDGRFDSCACVAESVARFVSAHARLVITIASPGRSHASHELPLAVRPSESGSGWIARALVHPSSWADAASVTVVSQTFAGRPIPCDSLPATLLVGYNHAKAPAGAVFDAAHGGDTLALQAALDAGDSTEEADEVRSTEEATRVR